MAVKYEVTNLGETAYLAQIRVSLSNMTDFAKIPSNCQLKDFDLMCDLEKGNALFNNQTVSCVHDISLLVASNAQMDNKTN